MKKLFISFIVLVLFASCESQSNCGIIKDTIVRIENHVTICEFVIEDDRGDLQTVEVTKSDYLQYVEGDVFCK